VLDGTDIVYVDRVRSSLRGQSEVATRLGRGSRLEASETAMGKVLLAHAPDAQREEALDAGATIAKQASAERAKLLAELDRIREKGFALADQVHVKGHRCVAAPIRSRSGEVIAAVEVAAAKSVFSRAEALDRLLPLVMASAEGMSVQLGYIPAG
jgi:IclR family pca regulon transcriptional regulator